MQKIGENILSWCSNIEEKALEQAHALSKHPWIIGNVCLMPDCHCGYGMPIGGVVALDNAVSPNMVGVDIGCGMLAVKTSLHVEDVDKFSLKAILSILRQNIPVGCIHQTSPQESYVFNVDEYNWLSTNICNKQLESAKYQIGTLGGGNHFIEIQESDDGHIWFMIHSGSRNLGKQVGSYYNQKAKDLCSVWKLEELVKNDLATLPRGTQEFDDYLREMEICLAFSYANRQKMASVIKAAFEKVLKNVDFEEEINIHHNYASLENHFGKNLFVHRKGATQARLGNIGIIPGSQGTSSYIVKGKGNKDSLCSSSHGAGRKMSRTAAIANLSLEDEIKLLDEKGIIHAIRNKKDLEESPSAYKDIDVVMEEQKDLVEILVKLKPLAVIKG